MEMNEVVEGIITGAVKSIIVGGLAIACTVIISRGAREAGPYLYPQPPAKTMLMDVNGDGLTDIVSRDGKVEIRQEDGSYTPLKEFLGKNKFFYRKISEINSVDNLDYHITKRYQLISE